MIGIQHYKEKDQLKIERGKTELQGEKCELATSRVYPASHPMRAGIGSSPPQPCMDRITLTLNPQIYTMSWLNANQDQKTFSIF